MSNYRDKACISRKHETRYSSPESYYRLKCPFLQELQNSSAVNFHRRMQQLEIIYALRDNPKGLLGFSLNTFAKCCLLELVFIYLAKHRVNSGGNSEPHSFTALGIRPTVLISPDRASSVTLPFSIFLCRAPLYVPDTLFC